MRTPARSSAAASQLRDVLPLLAWGSSATRAGASTVAGVLAAIVTDGWAAGLACATAGCSDAAGVSTVGAVAGSWIAGTSSGLAGVPAAADCLDATTGGWDGTTIGSFAREVVASMPGTGCVAGLEEATVFCGTFVFAAATPGIGLGSIAGTISFCVDIAAAASLAGRTDATVVELCSQPRS